MRNRVIIFVCLFLVLPLANSAQQKRSKIAPDEILFTPSEYKKVPGWRLAHRGSADPDGKYVLAYYDVSRMKKDGSLIQAWLKHDQKKGKDLISELLSLDEYNCVSRKHRWLQTAEYDPSGQVVWSSSKVSDWEYILPNSFGERVLDVICLKTPDMQEEEMRAAAKFFQQARQDEKRGQLKQAKANYYWALVYGGTDNKKINSALARIEAKDSAP